jgi:hypothetical protein
MERVAALPPVTAQGLSVVIMMNYIGGITSAAYIKPAAARIEIAGMNRFVKGELPWNGLFKCAIRL